MPAKQKKIKSNNESENYLNHLKPKEWLSLYLKHLVHFSQPMVSVLHNTSILIQIKYLIYFGRSLSAATFFQEFLHRHPLQVDMSIQLLQLDLHHVDYANQENQLVGAFVGVFIYYNCFGESAEIYSTQPTRTAIIYDGIAQIFGTFIFVYGIIYTCKRNYMKNQYFKYFFIVLMLLVGRTFTFRQGVLNPAVAFAFQFFASIRHQNSMLLFDIWGIIIGEIIGAILASYFYQNFYQPLLDQVEKNNQKQ